MTLEEAHAEMKKRGWGFARNRATGFYCVGPMKDGMISVLAFNTDFAQAIETAIKMAEIEEAIEKAEKEAKP